MKQHEKVAWRENKKAGAGYQENGVALSDDNSPMTIWLLQK